MLSMWHRGLAEVHRSSKGIREAYSDSLMVVN